MAKVLVVEDNFFVADIIQKQLEAAGHSVIGPVYRILDALLTATRDEADCAVLDVHLGPEGLVTPVAEALEALAIPFIFLTGFPLTADPTSPLGRFSNRVVLNKPYHGEALIRLVEAMDGLRLVPSSPARRSKAEERADDQQGSG